MLLLNARHLSRPVSVSHIFRFSLGQCQTCIWTFFSHSEMSFFSLHMSRCDSSERSPGWWRLWCHYCAKKSFCIRTHLMYVQYKYCTSPDNVYAHGTTSILFKEPVLSWFTLGIKPMTLRCILEWFLSWYKKWKHSSVFTMLAFSF